jgi:hypothetical protein
MGWVPGWTSLEPISPDAWRNWLECDQATWFANDPSNADPDTEAYAPRVARGVPDRVSRLKAIGNGQVPYCAATAWLILTSDDCL